MNLSVIVVSVILDILQFVDVISYNMRKIFCNPNTYKYNTNGLGNIELTISPIRTKERITSSYSEGWKGLVSHTLPTETAIEEILVYS